MRTERENKRLNKSSAGEYICGAAAYVCLTAFLQSAFFARHAICAAYGTLFILADFLSERFSERARGLKYLPPVMLILPFLAGITSVTAHIAELADCVLTAWFARFGTPIRLFEGAEYSLIVGCGINSAAAYAAVSAVKSEKKAAKILGGAAIAVLAATFAEDTLSAVCAYVSAAILISSCAKGGTLQLAARVCASSAAFAVFFSSAFCGNAAVFAEKSIADARFSGSGYVQPNGGISRAAAFLPEGTAALEVSADTPEPMYLHGFLGYDYSDGEWKGPDYSKLTARIEEISYLDSSGFGDADLAARLVEDSDGELEKNSVTVSVIGADSRYFYLPACPTDDEIGNGKSRALALENERGFFSADNTCTAEAVLGAVENSGKLADAAELQAEGSGNYLQNAALLDGIYRENFTALPDGLERILDAQLKDYECERGDLSAAANVIYDYLGGFSYDESAEGVSVEDFLQTTRSGYSIHFASAAAAIFRYYGIPARYAEGYAVTYDDVEGKLSGSPILLTDANFHAWAEYYLPGAGWIPFEATPEYFAKMPLPEGVTVGTEEAAAPSAPEGSASPQAVSGDRTASRLPDEDKDDDASAAIIFPIIAIAVTLTAAIFIIVRRKRAIRKIKNDPSYAVYRCVKMLSSEKEIPLAADGNYDFSAVGGGLAEELNALQEECCTRFYANISKEYTSVCEPYRVYSNCEKYLCKSKNTYRAIAVKLKETFMF